MNISQWLQRSAAISPNAPAVAHGKKTVLNYGELAARVAAIAGGLKTVFKLDPGDRVAIFAYNRPEYVEALFAIWHAGLVAVPVNAKLHPSEVSYILENSGARLCLTEGEGALEAGSTSGCRFVAFESDECAALSSHPPIAVHMSGKDDLAWLFYTSGTTGKPKGAMLSHGNLASMAAGYHAEVLQVRPGDAQLHAAPMSHGSGLYLIPHVMRRGVQVIPESGGFEVDEIFDLWAHWKGVSMFAAPTMVRRLTTEPSGRGFGNLDAIIYGGGPMYVADAKAALERFGPRLVQIYGQGESPMTITVLDRHVIADSADPRWEERLASVGIANPVVDMCVCDENDVPLPAGESGEILVRGDAVMRGYWQNGEATEKTLKGGWLHTGDVGTLDETGFLTLKDRTKDVIISGGSNIYPREVEEVLLCHDGVEEVSVIGRNDPEWGEVVIAYFVGSAKSEELDALCLGRIARFKRPKHYIRLDALPKNNYGKILKTRLRELDLENAGA